MRGARQSRMFMADHAVPSVRGDRPGLHRPETVRFYVPVTIVVSSGTTIPGEDDGWQLGHQ
jgi:hypothetical protein